LNYDYDPAGRRILAEVVGGARQTYTYDRRGQVLTETLEIDASIHETGYTYTLDGAVDTVTYPSGRVADFDHDFAGRPTTISVTAPGGGTTTILSNATYLPFGPAEDLDLGPVGGEVSESFGYDWQYRRTSQSVVGPGPTSLLDVGFVYDPAGNLTDVTDTLGDRDATHQCQVRRFRRSCDIVFLGENPDAKGASSSDRGRALPCVQPFCAWRGGVR